MNRCAVHVGRLLEIRAESGYRTAEDVDEIFGQIGRELDKVPASQRAVIVTDWRRCPVMGAGASERLVPLITRSNPRTERSGAIVSRDSPVALLQFIRVVRESKHADRRIFYETEALVEWLGEVLSPPETTRLRAFLNHEESQGFSSAI